MARTKTAFSVVGNDESNMNVNYQSALVLEASTAYMSPRGIYLYYPYSTLHYTPGATMITFLISLMSSELLLSVFHSSIRC